jgi:hypothetical protein
MDAFLHLCESNTIRPISVIKDCTTSKSRWVAIFDDGDKMFFGGRNDNRKQRFMTNLVEKYGTKYVADFSRKFPLEFAV